MKMSQFFPSYAEPQSESIRVILDLTNYATKSDLDNITHVDTSSFALKTNLVSLKSKVDKPDIDKLVAFPGDLSKLSTEVQEDFTKKTEFSALEKNVTDNKSEQDNLETRVQNNHLTTESSINNLKTKVDGIDLTKYVLKNDYDARVGNLDLKLPDISELLQTSAFNSEITEIEGKIKTAENKPDISNLATKKEVNDAFAKKTDYAIEIARIKNDYVTNAALTSQLSDLKATHISNEVKKVDDKVLKNTSDILGFESRLKQKEDLTTELEREASFFRGLYYYNYQIYLLFQPKFSSFNYTKNNGRISNWKSKGIRNANSIDLIGATN